MNKFLFVIFNMFYLAIIEYLIFGFTAKIKGKQCGYDCSKCTNWACTHGLNDQKGCYPVRDWGKWCKKC